MNALWASEKQVSEEHCWMAIRDAHPTSYREGFSSSGGDGAVLRLPRPRRSLCPLPSEQAQRNYLRSAATFPRAASGSPVSAVADTPVCSTRCGWALLVLPLCPVRSSPPVF